ncbi:hypothetical protein LTR66_007810, partial [Elasticomyces elasticus]
MGGTISKMMSKIFGSKEMRLLMLGLDAAGKTSTHRPFIPVHTSMLQSRTYRRLLSDGTLTCVFFLAAILYKLKLDQDVTTIPTVGFNVETVTYKNT